MDKIFLDKYKPELYAAAFNQLVAAKKENAQLREAAIHFQYCRECAEDGFCWLGRQHDDFLSSLNERKAV